MECKIDCEIEASAVGGSDHDAKRFHELHSNGSSLLTNAVIHYWRYR